MERIQQRLGTTISQNSVNTDFQVNIGLESNSKLISENDINKVVDVGVQFNKERQSSSLYRLLSTIRPQFTNVLFNTTGVNSMSSFGVDERGSLGYQNRFRDKTIPSDNNVTSTEDLTFDEAITQYLAEDNGWFGYTNPDQVSSTPCVFTDMTPNHSLFDLVSTDDVKNWEIKITYPRYGKYRTPNDITDGGLLIIDKSDGSMGNIPMLQLSTPIKHGLSQGDTVRISGLSPSTEDGDYTVERIGLDNGNLTEYSFLISADPTTLLGGNTRMTRIVNGKASEYYFRIFETITLDDDYEAYNLAFSKNVYGDKVIQNIFNTDIDISSLRDNLNRPLSELYITFIKAQNKGFSKVTAGLDMPNIPAIALYPQIPDVRRIHNGTLPLTHNFVENNITMSQLNYFGDVVEYNEYEVKETVLADVNHRFNTDNRDNSSNNTAFIDGSTLVMGPRVEGYYYKPHHKIQIRQFSSFVEQGDSSTEGIPDYAQSLGDGRFLWRDLLDIGFNDGATETLNYPFLNGCHYIHQNVDLNLRRQDPFGEYGLYYSHFPKDPLGERLFDENISTKTIGNDC